MGALFIRISLVCINVFVFSLSPGDSDVYYMGALGERFADYFLGNIDVKPEALAGTYVFGLMIGLVYMIFGKIEVFPQIIVVLLSIGMIYYIYKLTWELSKNLACARVSAAIATVFPAYNLYASLLLRETFVNFFAILSVYLFVKGWTKKKKIYAFMALFPLLFASSAHSGVVFLGVVYAVMLTFYDDQNEKWSFFQIHKIVGTGIIGIMIFFAFGSEILNKFSFFLGNEKMEMNLNEHLSNYAKARAAYLIGYFPADFMDIFIQTPIRVIYFLFTPFPTMIFGFNDLIAGIDACLYGVFCYYGFKGMGILRKENKGLFWVVLLSMSFMLIVFAWGTSNYGAALRHRQKIVFLFIIVASIGYIKKRINR
ncbi:hypothetical protein BTW32_09755 [Bacillus thuringiensis]|nr:hypothetical protein BTW32_09755 [Bacillus thuringiensis]